MSEINIFPKDFINCKNCIADCDDQDRIDCRKNNLIWFHPKDQNACKGCPMLSGNSNGKCCRHSEPCWKQREGSGK